ncbi:pyridoxal-dependent aspartate 1-decarboxylase PanP [Opacimonas viscosa]|uniref:Pyridoxal-dependent aspartate 1-decarboxylase n=1 Tax=Opacimonas viscosa TaxID=2961944 RepID=A0AA41X0T3_9ALTE|nr:putative pyridoxal-dependent aspartate 1-decarboxylase [Opacimonas viscosa]MCP3429645.1 putative pyridoxal-dependent aspartate 1-decarboxylase [Opacimonas viscosa]
MSNAEASLEHLFRVFTMPEHKDSTLSRIEQHLSDNLSDFLSRHVVAKKTSLESIEKDFSTASLPQRPEFVSEFADQLLDKLVAHSVNTYAPTFIGHMTSALPYFHLSLAKLLVGLNQNLVKIETSKAFTPLERQVLGMMHNLVYGKSDAFYEQYLHSANHSLGAFCSGGTIANMTALWVARNKCLGPKPGFAGVTKAGLASAYRAYGINELGIVSSKRGHYSLAKAADLLGMGRNNLHTLNHNEQTLDPDAVRTFAKQYAAQGNQLLAIVGVAGTTETGHIDPLDELADVAEELGCWFHVDAAWGGATLFSDTHRAKLKGIERADSVTLDAHKQMYVPMGAGMALFKDPKHSSAVRHHAQYILREGSKDLGATTLEGSRNGMAMMVYSSLHVLGKSGYELLIDQSIDKAQHFAQMITAHCEFELVTEPTLSLLTYRLVPQDVQKALLADISDADKTMLNEQINALTKAIQKQQREAGKSFVSRTRLSVQAYGHDCLTVFRVVIANPLTTQAHLSSILTEQTEIAAILPEYTAVCKTAEKLIKKCSISTEQATLQAHL